MPPTQKGIFAKPPSGVIISRFSESIPNISYFIIFGSNHYILNNSKSHLTKFNKKTDEGIFLGYSLSSKSCMCFKKTVHVKIYACYS
ncbi:hypothetical protein KSP40_PGU015105 [Platanthera guangdongensis]|uniref:Uncharacterized protein n=1 Tax=Platanthera guangdongensis TaxID=2320717 RepID=A0ABR2N1R6_9ASPA